MATLVEAPPTGQSLFEAPTTDFRPWSEKIRPRTEVRDELIAIHRSLHRIPEDDWWHFQTSFRGTIHRRTLEEANMGWPLIDSLWGEKFLDGIPEDKTRQDLDVRIGASHVLVSSPEASIALHMNTFPGVFVVVPRGNNPDLVYEAAVYIEQGARTYDPGYETRSLRGNLFDHNVVLNNATAATQILDFVHLIKNQRS